MSTQKSMILLALLLAPLAALTAAKAAGQPMQYILLNEGDCTAVQKEFGHETNGEARVGVGATFSYFRDKPEKTEADLRGFLQKASSNNVPVLVALDGECWWGGRPDLWNWWDPSQPGFDPANRENVEWFSWSSDDALKIAWLNWGRQIRMPPAPNLMSPRYRAACQEQMSRLVPILVDWWRGLPPEKQHLFVGLKLGWESSLGVNQFHYPDGNALLNAPAGEDPTKGLKTDLLPSRGLATLGYAAAKSAGLRKEGTLTEADQAEIIRRHLADLSHQAARLGLPRERVFVHGGGWKEGELLYQSALNTNSCPGWSFYRHAEDPRRDTGAQEALMKSDAPYWGAPEWLFRGAPTVGAWRAAMENTLGVPRCRFLCIFSWRNIETNPAALAAIHELCQPAAMKNSGKRPPLWAVYYAWYTTATGPHGKWSLWGDAKDKGAEPKPRGMAQPLIGYYDSDNPDVVRWHVRLAKAAGIDAFLVSWWGGANVSGKAFEQAVLPIAESERFKVAMCSELAQFHSDVKVLARQMTDVLKRTTVSPAYLRMDGKPVVYLYQVPFDSKLTRETFRVLCRSVEAEVGPVYWMLDKVGNADNKMAVPAEWLALPEIPMVGCYGTFSLKREWTYDRLLPDYRRVAEAAHGAGKKVFLPAHPGHDNSGFRPDDFFVIPREGGATLRGYLRCAADAGADVILLSSFNEWPETTIVEPSASWPDPYLYLKIIAEWKGIQLILPSLPPGVTVRDGRR